MHSEACTRIHDGIPTIAEGVHIAVAQTGGQRAARLLRHALPLGPLNEDQLRAVDVMGLNHTAIPGGGSGPGWEQRSSDIVQSRCTADEVAVSGAKPGVVPAVLGEGEEV